MNHPHYRNKPIGSIHSLAKMLQIPVDELFKLAEDADSYYLENTPEQKPDGKVRITYRLKPRLQEIQQRINQEIFHAVDYPPYLQGSIKDKESPRNYIHNASLHTGRRIVIREDISSFFPSINTPVVMKMWQHFFHFPKEVAEVLTKLTTYRGIVPQGAPTSSYIANLIFWDKEPQVEDQLQQLGLRYSRFVDDVTVSSDKFVDKQVQQTITTIIYGMFRSIDVRPNRSKRQVQSSTNRMSVHRLNVNSGKPTLSKQSRAEIRAAVKQCEEAAKVDRTSEEYGKQYQRVHSRVYEMRKLHHNEAEKYLKRLQEIKPISQNAG